MLSSGRRDPGEDTRTTGKQCGQKGRGRATGATRAVRLTHEIAEDGKKVRVGIAGLFSTTTALGKFQKWSVTINQKTCGLV